LVCVRAREEEQPEDDEREDAVPRVERRHVDDRDRDEVGRERAGEEPEYAIFAWLEPEARGSGGRDRGERECGGGRLSTP
jgi:hypothetical protein